MGLVISAAPLIFFIAVTVLSGNQWRWSLALLFIGPIIATFLVLAGGALFDIISDPASDFTVSGMPAYFFTGYILVGVNAIYPRGAWVAAITLIAWWWLGRALVDRSRRKHLLSASIAGWVAGTFTAAALVLFFQSNALIDLIAVPGDPNTRHPSPLSIQLTLLTGLCDGILLAYLSYGFEQSEASRAKGASITPL